MFYLYVLHFSLIQPTSAFPVDSGLNVCSDGEDIPAVLPTEPVEPQMGSKGINTINYICHLEDCGVHEINLYNYVCIQFEFIMLYTLNNKLCVSLIEKVVLKTNKYVLYNEQSIHA